MADNEIIVEIKAKLDDLERGLKSMEKTAKDSGDKAASAISDSFSSVSNKILGIGAAIAGAFAFGKIIKEATDAEASLRLFNSSLAAAGNFSQAASDRFVEFAQSLQATTKFGDDLIIQNASVLASLGELSGKGLERATQAALDLASTGRVDVTTAFDLVAKAAAGSTASLSRYGIKIDETIPKAEKFNTLLTILESKFGGLSQAQTVTFAGSLAKLSNNFTDILENLGKLITQSPQAVSIINNLGTAFGNIAKSIESFGKTGQFESFLIGTVSVIKTIITSIIGAFEFLGNLLAAIALGITTVINGILVAINAIPAALGTVIGKVIEFSSALGGIVGIFNEELGDKITAGISQAGKSFAAASQELVNGPMNDLKMSAEATGFAIKEMFTLPVSQEAAAFLEGITNVSNLAQEPLRNLGNQGAASMQKLSDAAVQAGKQTAAAFKQGVVNVISTGIQEIVGGIAKGTLNLQNFTKKILGLLGDMAIQIGAILIAAGIGMQSLFQLNGAQAIIAGIALIALGSVLKAFSGGEGGETSVAGAVPGGSVGAPSPATQQAPGGGEALAAQQGTSVAVNIQGNVLDRKETGLEIARTIQEFFDVNGNVVAGGTA